jgi:predicted RND superfamily exporter protein
MLLLAVGALTIGGLAQVRVDTGVESFLPSESAAYSALEDKARSFGGDPVVVLLESRTPQELLLRQNNLARLLGMEGKLARIPDVAAVQGPATVLNQIAGSAQNMLAQISGRGDALRNAVQQQEKRAGSDQKAVADAKAALARFDQRYAALLVRAMPAGLPTLHNARFVASVLYGDDAKPRAQWKFVLPNDHTVAVLVRPREHLDQAATARLVTGVKSTVDRAGLPVKRTTVTGTPALTSALTHRAQYEMPVLGAIAVLAVGVVFLGVRWSRKRRARLRPLLCTLAGTALTLAAFGWLQHPLSLGVVAFLPILLGIGSDFPVYLSQPGQRRRVLVTALAAATGFAALALSPLPFVRELGLALAVGIGATVTAALGMRNLFGPIEPAEAHARRLPAIPVPATRPRRVTALAAAITIAAIGWGALPFLGIESRPDQLARGLPALEQAQYAQRVLGSSGEVAIMLKGNNVLSPEALQWAAEAESAIVRAHGDQLQPVLTTPDLLRFLGNRPTQDQITSATELLPDYLTSAVTRPDRRASVMIFGVRMQDLNGQRELFDAVRGSLPRPPHGLAAELVGLPTAAVRGLDLVSSERSLMNLVGITAAGLVLFAGLGNRRDAGRAILTALIATGWVLGLAWLAIGTLSPLTVAIGSLTTATGCEFAVMLAGAHSPRQPRMLRNVAVAASAGVVGYLTLTLSGLAVLRQFGLLLSAAVALSYLAAWVVVRLLPAPHGGVTRQLQDAPAREEAPV